MCLLCIETFRKSLTKQELINAYTEQAKTIQTHEDLAHLDILVPIIELELELKENLELLKSKKESGELIPPLLIDNINDLQDQINKLNVSYTKPLSK